MKYSLVAFFAVLPVLLSCSSERASNGTGSNAGEAGLAIAFKTPSGSPLAHAAVRVWDVGTDSLSVEDSLVADDDGNAVFDSSLSGWKLIVANSGDSLSVMRLVNFGDTLPGSLTAEFPESLKGKMIKNGSPLSGVAVRVLDKISVTGADGSFEFAGLPSGTHFVFVSSASRTRAFQMQTTDTANVGDFSDTVYTLVENFENWNQHTLLGKIWGGGWWFESTDSAFGGGSFVSPDFRDTAAVIISEGAYSGKSLYAKFNVDTTFTNGRFALVGFTLGGDFDEKTSAYLFDLSKLTAVSFVAKGSGIVNLQMVRRDSTGAKEYHNVPFNLSSEWSRYEIDASRFGAAMTAVNALNFMADSSAEIYLDDIRLEGIAPADWILLGTK